MQFVLNLKVAFEKCMDIDENIRFQAENYIKIQEKHPYFLIALLIIINNNSTFNKLNFIVSIHFKNSVKIKFKNINYEASKEEIKFIEKNLISIIMNSTNIKTKKQLVISLIYLNKFVLPENCGFFGELIKLIKTGIEKKKVIIILNSMQILDELCSYYWRNQILNKKNILSN